VCVCVCVCVCICVRACVCACVWSSRRHQEGTEHVEADEVDDGEAAATALLLPEVVVRVRVTLLAGQAGQHNLLPGLARRTPGEQP